MKKMKKIQSKITKYIIFTVLIVSIAFSTVSIFTTYTSTERTIKSTISEASTLAANTVSNAISNYTYVVKEISTNSILTDTTVPLEEKIALLDKKTQEYYMNSAGIVSKDGINHITSENVSTEPFFTKAMAGETYMSSPYIAKDKTSAYIIVSAPIISNETVTDIIYFVVDTNVIDNAVNSSTIGELGSSYILDKNGVTIAYSSDNSLVLNQENTIMQSQADPSNAQAAQLAAIEQKMINGETGFDDYYYNNVAEFQAYAPIPNSDGWSIAITVNRDEFMQLAYQSMITIGIMLAVILVVSLILGKKLGSSIGKPIELCVNRITALSQGDLTSDVPVIKSNDETKLLAISTETMIVSLNAIITDLSSILTSMSKGDMTNSTQVEYNGDFQTIEKTLSNILSSFNSTLNQITTTSSQVSAISNQVSSGAQVLAQGATEQASAVQELSSSIAQVAEHIKQTSDNSSNASEYSSLAREKLLEGNEEMQSLLKAMEEIDRSSMEISNIIKTIEDISFQTNILALNAAVEAARAGAAGKGFAVVADEVRNLATKSSEAAKETTKLIESSIVSVKKGVDFANKTAETLQAVLEKAKNSSTLIAEIAVTAKEQANAIEQIYVGVDQISNVVQTNSATSQESAALCEELLVQSDTMKDLTSQFKLK